MAVLGWRRVLQGTGFSGKVGEPLRFDEAWLIRVDSLFTPRLQIVKAVPCGWYAAHWEMAACRAMEFKLAPATKEGLLWRLDVAFYPPPPSAKLKSNGIPEDYWDASGGSTSVPVFRDRDGQMILNAAGDPVEGLQREREEKSWSLVKFYEDDSWKADRKQYAGSVNQSAWDDGDPGTWKCYFKNAKRREIQNVSRGVAASSAQEGVPSSGGTDDTLTVVETSWEFRYDPGTWKAMPWDVGFHELAGGKRKAILDGGNPPRPVKQPVALNSSGTAKADGESPIVIRNGQGAKLYPETNFAQKFGDPFIAPQA